MVNQAAARRVVNDNKRRLLAPLQRRDTNAVYLNTHNSLEHELKKCEIAYKLKKQGHTFVTEAILNNGKQPDILVLDIPNPIAYEITYSESDESIKLKHENYKGITVQQVEARPQ